ncbi:hypothetical protein E1B28_003378 [Marasmius oreades]|uniref:Uncharacterized protein n=1 Tax=Marasmius oreades TaxID=181124 RepID=A0A9P7RLC6_9AGAR|nr:uncharacterized protein E1B28_003378 [Marasmius oreades]KAG7085841.1 hypothetical protein E1B28_003378 [Marasmius oreades]
MEHLVCDRKVGESLLEQKVNRLLAAISRVTERQAMSSSTAAVTSKAASRRTKGSWVIPKIVCAKYVSKYLLSRLLCAKEVNRWEYAIDWKAQNPHGTLKDFGNDWKTTSKDTEKVAIYQARADEKLRKNRKAT